MGVDYVIDFACPPKRELSTMGILSRLKARERAAAVIQLYRENGDQRPPSEMGFEMVRRTADGQEETQVIIIQNLLDEAATLTPHESHCMGCPANRSGESFGCYGNLRYPVSRAGELWLLKQLPTAETPLIFLLIREMITANRSLGEQASAIRADNRAIFETPDVFGRVVEGITATTNHLFELLFFNQGITPSYGVMILLFLNAIPNQLEASELQTLTPAAPDYATQLPFALSTDPADDPTIRELKAFLETLYLAYGLDCTVSLDP
jgi:hypothetical protein